MLPFQHKNSITLNGGIECDILDLDLESLINSDELLASKEISTELKLLGQNTSMYRTDCAAVSNTKEPSNQFSQELLIPLMHKIMIRNSIESAAEKIRSLFSCEYENNRL